MKSNLFLSALLLLAATACSEGVDSSTPTETPTTETPTASAHIASATPVPAAATADRSDASLQETAPDDSTPEADSLFGAPKKTKPIKIRKPPVLIEVSHDEQVARTLIHGRGSALVFQHLKQMAFDAEIERRKIAGEPWERAMVSEEEAQVKIDATMATFADKNPTIDFADAVAASGYTMAAYKKEIRRGMGIQRLFFPTDPELWQLDLLKEVFGTGSEQAPYDAWVLPTHTAQMELKAKGEEITPMNDQSLQMFFMPPVWRWMFASTDVRYPFDGLPEGVALEVNGVQAMTADLMAELAPNLSAVDRKFAENWVHNIERLDAALAKSGHLLSPVAAREIIDVEAAKYVGTIITHEQMVLQFYGFPSMDLFHHYTRMRESFRSTLPDEIPIADLEEHLLGHGSYLTAGKVNAEILLLTAKNLLTNSYSLDTDSFALAKIRADEVSALLAAEGADFGAILDEHSDYPDVVPGQNPQIAQPHKGRLGAQSRNDLRGFCAENDYHDFIFGASLADTVFNQKELNQVFGPVQTPLGYSFYRVLGHVEGESVLDLDGDENHRLMVTEDYVTTEFLAYLASLQE
ncbi:MAG: hypothetical protein HN405_04500 [Planctomycetes bacterium]|jgi:hypothetical protein|nr:hypothetical protein [Planctomycetota bacterium]MBT4029500.1 hypothetical protein [Planctomycetota bacterium]MBT4560630.1 hypothetical protein [Planctomycetota bacterium]MBT5101204.1 hypothetical protein [Planctomycetota bacterium]MBT7317694.1 hypothetical protein [Planctomycetota bacterium]